MNDPTKSVVVADDSLNEEGPQQDDTTDVEDNADTAAEHSADEKESDDEELQEVESRPGPSEQVDYSSSHQVPSETIYPVRY